MQAPLVASTELLIPVDVGSFAFEGMRQLLERAWRCWGLCRHRHLLDLKVHVRIPALEDHTQLPVECPDSCL
jgi:hypothetical protein